MRDRWYFFTPPAHAKEWYKANCCPACGWVNGTGQLCTTTTHCMDCGIVQCMGVASNCRKCGAPLAGFSKSEEYYKRWLRAKKRRERRQARG